MRAHRWGKLGHVVAGWDVVPDVCGC